jgi:outer membrane biosynthesis protein TonB
MKKRLFLAAVVSLWLPYLAASDDTAKQKEAVSKIEQAAARANIFELSSFRMKANVQIESQGKLLDGSYQLLWNGPEQWREEIHFPGYTEVQVGGKGTVWVQRSTDFYPLRISDLRAALGFGSQGADSNLGRVGSLTRSGVTPKDKIKKVHERKEHGAQETCIEYERRSERSWEICVNDGTNTLVRSPRSFADNDLQPIGGKVYPRSLSYSEDGKTLAKAEVTEFTTPGQFSPDSFAPPSGIQPQAGCMNPAPAVLVKKRAPEYPPNARQQRVQGLVAVDARIGVDGVPKIGKVVAHASPELEQSSINTLQDWRYEPAECDGKPVEVETVLEFKYFIQ